MKFSCYTTSYNPPNKEWLKQAMDSTEGLFDEYLILDDGSDVPIKEAHIRNEKNMGLSFSRNRCIEQLTGDIITAIDDDDYLIKENIPAFKKFIKDHPEIDIFHFPVGFIGEIDGYWGRDYDYSQFPNSNQIPASSWFRKKVWDQVKYEYHEAEDWDFFARAYKKGFKFGYFDNPIYVHRVRKDSFWGTETERSKNFINIRKVIKERYEKEKTN